LKLFAADLDRVSFGLSKAMLFGLDE